MHLSDSSRDKVSKGSMVNVDLLDRLTKSAREVPDGLVLPFEDGLEGANFPFCLTEHKY